MALYQHGARTAITTTNSAIWELRSTATARLRIREIGIFMAAATASSFGLGRPAAIGVTPTSPVTVQALDAADPAGTGTTAIAWGTAPTVPTSSIYLRRVAMPATVGAGVIWTFPLGAGLVIPISSSLCVFNLAVNGVTDIYVLIDE